MTRITIESVSFSHNHPFRRFQGLEVPFAPGITLICGHNGIGKSTILGLLASCSGLPTRAVKTYLGKTFNANIGEIIYIDFATEIEPRLAANAVSEPLLTYSVGGAPFQKKCSLTRKKGAKRARSVPRSVPYGAAKIGDVAITKDQKVPLPTLYLGMIRMLPVGEVLESRLSTAAEADWHEDDKRLVERFMGKVIGHAGGAKAGGQISVNHVLQTKKLSAHPEYPYSPRSVSIGQDSLGAIAAGLASFQRLKREMGAGYPGGLLIIDELDAGFHPHAIRLLVQELRRLAKELSLQIVATTHSTRLIEAVHPQGPVKTPGSHDRVVYLQDTLKPELDPTLDLAAILADMDVAPVEAAHASKARLYFEDAEAVEVFKAVTSPTVVERLEKKHGVVLEPVDLGVGCDSLAKLPKRDPYFGTVVLVADGDVDPGDAPANLAALPSDGVSNGNQGPSPERTLLRYIRRLRAEDKSAHKAAWDRLKPLGVNSRDRLDMFLGDPDLAPERDRKYLKKWWKGHADQFKAWGLYELWAEANPRRMAAYEKALEDALDAAMKARRTMVVKIRRGEALD